MHCREIIPHISKEHLDVLDLKEKLSRIVEMIEAWCPKRTLTKD